MTTLGTRTRRIASLVSMTAVLWAVASVAFATEATGEKMIIATSTRDWVGVVILGICGAMTGLALLAGVQQLRGGRNAASDRDKFRWR